MDRDLVRRKAEEIVSQTLSELTAEETIAVIGVLASAVLSTHVQCENRQAWADSLHATITTSMMSE
jgi:hypothetical protein